MKFIGKFFVGLSLLIVTIAFFLGSGYFFYTLFDFMPYSNFDISVKMIVPIALLGWSYILSLSFVGALCVLFIIAILFYVYKIGDVVWSTLTFKK